MVVVGVVIASLGVGYVRAATSVSRLSNLLLVDFRFAVRVWYVFSREASWSLVGVLNF